MRLLLIISAEHAAALAKELGPHQVSPEFGPALSPSGEEPVTHRWAAGDFDALVSRKALAFLCGLVDLGAPAPLVWGRWADTQREVWVSGIRGALWNALGAWVACGEVDASGELRSRGLQRVREAANAPGPR